MQNCSTILLIHVHLLNAVSIWYTSCMVYYFSHIINKLISKTDKSSIFLADVEEFLKSSSRHDQLMKSAITSGKSREDSSTSLEIGSKTGSDSLDEGISDRGSDSEIEFKTKKITLSKSDPSIYHSCQSIDIGRVSFHSSASEGRACSPIGLSSSSQDTSTSAEFNVPNSYRGLCNIYDGHEDATDSVLGDSNGREPVEHGESDSEQTAPPSPGERVIHDTDFKQEENWDSDCDNDVTITKEEVSKRYFHIVLNETDMLTKQRSKNLLINTYVIPQEKKGLEYIIWRYYHNSLSTI